MESRTPTSRRWLFLWVIPLLAWLLGQTGVFDRAEEDTLDWRFRLRGDQPAPVKVVYIDVDSRSISDLGNQPWDRAYFAEVSAAAVETGGAKAVGIDYVFSDNGVPDLVDRSRFDEGRRLLAEYLNGNPPPPVVVAASYASPAFRDVNQQLSHREFPRVGTAPDEASLPELPEFRVGGLVYGAPNVGLIDTIQGGTRAVHAFAEVGAKRWNHMAVELARLYWDLPPDAVRLTPRELQFVRDDGTRVASIPLAGGQDVAVNWFSRWQSPEHNPRVSFSQALVCARALQSGTADERREAEAFYAPMRGAIVLIGPVDPLLHDLASTPLDPLPVPRVGIHGNLVKTIVSGKYLHGTSPAIDALIIFLVTLAVAACAVSGKRTGVAWRIAAVGVLVLYVAVALVVFVRNQWVLPIAAPVSSALITALVGLALRLVGEERQKRRIQGLFGTYLSPELVNRMVESGDEPKLGGVEAQITAFFSDIENFTALSEALAPAQLVELMNQYLTASTDGVTERGGTLDKYVGDAVIAMFGAPVPLPDHAWRACVAAHEMQVRLDELRKRWVAEGQRWPEAVATLRTRIGLASGLAVVGNMGSQTRFNYTMTGDTVNLASRLESACKIYGAGILVSEQTHEECTRYRKTLLFRPLDRLVVPGKTKPVRVFELMGVTAVAPSSTKECVELFSAGMESYLARDWLAAERLFAKSALLEPRRDGKPENLTPSQVFLRRCARWRAEAPPADWGGVWVQEHK